MPSASESARLRLIEDNEIPSLPEGWDVRRFRFLFRESKERNGQTPVGSMLSVSEYRGVVPKEYEHVEQQRTDEELQTYRVVRPGQMAVNTMWLNHLGLGVSDYLGHVSPAYAVYEISPELNKRFIHHLFRSQYYLKLYLRYLYGIRPNSFQIKSDDWNSIPVIVPPSDTQKHIADFLDRETARIDQLIEKKQRLLVVTNERKANFILSAVTQGLTSEAQLSPSGLEWAPLLPSHWQPTRLRHLGQSIIGLTYSPDDLTSDGQGVPVLRANNIQAGRLISDGLIFVSKAVPDKLILREGDILICSRNGSRNLIGKNARASGEFLGMTFGAFNTVYRSKYSDFIYWVLQSPIFSYQAGAYLTSTINQLTVTTLGNLVVPLPPIQEQKAICSYIEERMPVFDGLLDNVQASISKLQELRAALITAAVTGQIDVTTWGKRGHTSRSLDRLEEENALREARA